MKVMSQGIILRCEYLWDLAAFEYKVGLITGLTGIWLGHEWSYLKTKANEAPK